MLIIQYQILPCHIIYMATLYYLNCIDAFSPQWDCNIFGRIKHVSLILLGGTSSERVMMIYACSRDMIWPSSSTKQYCQMDETYTFPSLASISPSVFSPSNNWFIRLCVPESVFSLSLGSTTKCHTQEMFNSVHWLHKLTGRWSDECPQTGAVDIAWCSWQSPSW